MANGGGWDGEITLKMRVAVGIELKQDIMYGWGMGGGGRVGVVGATLR